MTAPAPIPTWFPDFDAMSFSALCADNTVKFTGRADSLTFYGVETPRGYSQSPLSFAQIQDLQEQIGDLSDMQKYGPDVNEVVEYTVYQSDPWGQASTAKFLIRLSAGLKKCVVKLVTNTGKVVTLPIYSLPKCAKLLHANGEAVKLSMTNKIAGLSDELRDRINQLRASAFDLLSEVLPVVSANLTEHFATYATGMVGYATSWRCLGPVKG